MYLVPNYTQNSMLGALRSCVGFFKITKQRKILGGGQITVCYFCFYMCPKKKIVILVFLIIKYIYEKMLKKFANL